jgi:hypothetical protein
MLQSYWQLRAIDLLKERIDFPAHQKDAMIRDLILGSQLNDVTNDTYLSGFKVLKDFDRLTIEVMRVLDNAEKEIYFASRYHDPHVSELFLKKFLEGIRVHILDGTPTQISMENRINAILRTPRNRDIYNSVQSMIKSTRFELLRLETLPRQITSFGQFLRHNCQSLHHHQTQLVEEQA